MSMMWAMQAVVLASVWAVQAPPSNGLLLWLDAGDKTTLRLEGDAVDAWLSKAPGAVQAAQGVGIQRPCYLPHEDGALRPAVRFDGVDDVLRLPAFNQRADTWSLIVVCAPWGPLKGGGLCSASSPNGHDYDPGFTVDLFQSSAAFDQVSIEGAGRVGGQQDQMQHSFALGGAHVVAVVRNAEKVLLYIDGQEEGRRDAFPAGTVMNELRIGARCYEGVERCFFHGDISQVMLYARALEDTERHAIEEGLRVGDAERRAGETSAVQEAARIREERMKNRMKSPHVVASWPNVKEFLAGNPALSSLAVLPVRKDIREAIELGMRHLNSLYDRDHDNEPYFYANCMADGTGKMRHSVNIGIPHVVGRCLLACMMGEMATGIPFPAEGLAILERYCKSSFDNADHLNSYYDPEKGGARCIEFHNMREGLYGLWALIAGRDDAWARDTAHAMLETLDRLTDADGCWASERIASLGMNDRCFGVAIPNASRVVEPLLAYFECTGDPLAMKLAGLYARRALATMFTADGHFAPMEQSSGHVHSITSTLSGLAAYAVKTHDQGMLDACCRIMDTGVPEYFSSWGWGDEVFPDHPADEVSRGEINQTGDVIRTALLLGEAGFSRYYEMAERYLRSMLLPTQHRASELRAFLRNKENPADDSERDVVERSVGGYAMQLPNDRMRKGDWPVTTLDITSGAVHAMSVCYRRCVDTRDGVCRVNLLFDCDTDSVGIRSGLPFEGRLDFTVKKPLERLEVMLPAWVDRATVRVTVNGVPHNGPWLPDRLGVNGLHAGDTGTIAFDIPCRIEKETVDGIEYTTTWVGNQIIAILPRGEVSPLPY